MAKLGVKCDPVYELDFVSGGNVLDQCMNIQWNTGGKGPKITVKPRSLTPHRATHRQHKNKVKISNKLERDRSCEGVRLQPAAFTKPNVRSASTADTHIALPNLSMYLSPAPVGKGRFPTSAPSSRLKCRLRSTATRLPESVFHTGRSRSLSSSDWGKAIGAPMSDGFEIPWKMTTNTRGILAKPNRTKPGQMGGFREREYWRSLTVTSTDVFSEPAEIRQRQQRKTTVVHHVLQAAQRERNAARTLLDFKAQHLK